MQNMKIIQNTENKTCQAKKREVARLFKLLIWSRAASAWVCKAFDNIWKESRNTLRTPIPNFLGNIKGIINNFWSIENGNTRSLGKRDITFLYNEFVYK